MRYQAALRPDISVTAEGSVSPTNGLQRLASAPFDLVPATTAAYNASGGISSEA